MGDDSGIPAKKRKTAFVEGWLSDDRFKSWISRVDGDINSFRCTLCNKTLSCSSGHVNRHHSSHLKSKANGDSSAVNAKKPYKQKF